MSNYFLLRKLWYALNQQGIYNVKIAVEIDEAWKCIQGNAVPPKRFKTLCDLGARHFLFEAVVQDGLKTIGGGDASNGNKCNNKSRHN